MFTKIERLISLRNLRPKKKEGFLKVISIFSFLGIMLGVAILIIVMSVMNGFKTDLTNKILGLNPHIVVQSNGFKIEDQFITDLKYKFITSHTGRRSFATNLYKKGIPITHIMKATGHVKETDFLKYIQHTDEESMVAINNILKKSA